MLLQTVVRLNADFRPESDEVIPAGTLGAVIQVFDDDAVQIEFDESWMTPETVPIQMVDSVSDHLLHLLGACRT